MYPYLPPRRSFIYLDACIVERCNLTCAYCRDSNTEKAPFPDPAEVYRTFDRLLGDAEYAVLKTSGYGEATLWPGLDAFLDRYAAAVPTIQLITNGVNTDRVVELAKRYDNLVPCVTLDGDEVRANSLRIRDSGRAHNQILATLGALAELGRATEVNSVLGPWNISTWSQMVAALWAKHPGMFYFIPFPHRPFGGVQYVNPGVGLVAIDEFRAAVEMVCERFPRSVPPPDYFAEVDSFLRTGSRRTPCFVHEANCGVSPTLRVLRCACSNETTNSQFSSNDLGSADELGSPPVAAVRLKQLAEGRIGERCSGCLNHYELANLYLLGRVSPDRFAEQPCFRKPDARACAERARLQLAESRQIAVAAKLEVIACESLS